MLGQTAGGAGNGSPSPFFAVSSGPTGTVKSVQVSVAMDGQGSSQRSVVVVTAGEGGEGAGMQASTRGTSRTNADRNTIGIASTSVLNGTGEVTSFAAGRVPDNIVQNGSGVDTQLGGGSTPYGYRQNGFRVTSPPVVGPRETLTLNGYATAFADSTRADGRIEPSTPLLAGQNGVVGQPTNVAIQHRCRHRSLGCDVQDDVGGRTERTDQRGIRVRRRSRAGHLCRPHSLRGR